MKQQRCEVSYYLPLSLSSKRGLDSTLSIFNYVSILSDMVRLFIGMIFHLAETRLPSRLDKSSKGIFGQAHTYDMLTSCEPPLCHQRRFLYYSSYWKKANLLQALEQFWLKELADGDILCQTLSSSCLEHEVSRKCLCARGLERSQRDVLVEWVSRYDGPAIEDER